MTETVPEKHAHKVHFEQRVLLIKPTVDASNKELHSRNNMLNAEKNLKKYLNEEAQDTSSKTSFVPRKLGQMTKNDLGVKMNVVNLRQEGIDFNKEVSKAEVDELLKRLKKAQDMQIGDMIAKDSGQDTAAGDLASMSKNLLSKMMNNADEEDEWKVVKLSTAVPA